MSGDGAMFTSRARSTGAVVCSLRREAWRFRQRVSFIQGYGSLCTADHIGDFCAPETLGLSRRPFRSGSGTVKEDFVAFPLVAVM